MAILKLKNKSRFLLMSFCLMGFFHQSYDLYSGYMSGKTVVNIKVETILNQTLPAITVCFSSHYILDKIDENDPIIIELKQRYLERIDLAIKLDKLYENSTELDQKIEQEYFLNVTKINERLKFLHSQLNMINFFENVTFPFNFGNISLIKTRTSGLFEVDQAHIISIFGKPIESLTNFHGLKKCFTFFSHLQKEWRKFKINLDKLFLEILEFPHNLVGADQYFYLAIHSPNNLPKLTSDQEFKKLGIHSRNHFRFSRVETRLLGSGFDTNCFDYDLDHKFANYNMRSDCITSCLMENSSCSPDKFIATQYLLRKQFFENMDNISAEVCPLNDVMGEKYMKRKEMECMSRCRKDCSFSYFLTDYHGEKYDTFKRAFIDISRNQLPDILITHLPDITFNAFVCNFGGLLGLWLGLSVLSIFNELSIILYELFMKRPRITKMYQFIVNNNLNLSTRKIIHHVKRIK